MKKERGMRQGERAENYFSQLKRLKEKYSKDFKIKKTLETKDGEKKKE